LAIYHLHTKIISRSKGKSSVGASAYRSGEKLYNERDGLEHDYTRKKGVVYKEILAPKNAPKWATNREKLWNEVEKIEKSKNSQLAREIDVALPIELSLEKQIDLLRNYVQDIFVNKGMVADFVIHDKKDGNPHAHIMLTMRPFNESGEWGAKAKKEYILDKQGNKIYDKKGNAKSRKIETTNWNKKETLEHWREQWAFYTNRILEKENIKAKIDHRSYDERGIDKLPMKHEGVAVKSMEKRGVKTEIGSLNREIRDLNRTIELINKQIKVQEGMQEVLYGLENNGNRDENIRVRTRDDEMEQGHRRYSIGTNITDGSAVEKLKQLAREKKERDREHQERIERENRKRLEQERQKSNAKTIRRIRNCEIEL
jgi:ATP-dependent exoDNAse (exonuclease V) alpha subunit